MRRSRRPSSTRATRTSSRRTCARPRRRCRSPTTTSPLFAGDVAAVVASLVEAGLSAQAEPRAGSGPVATGRPTSPTSARAGAARCGSSRESTGRLVGTVDACVCRTRRCTRGAVYVHIGQTYLVSRLRPRRGRRGRRRRPTRTTPRRARDAHRHHDRSDTDVATSWGDGDAGVRVGRGVVADRGVPEAAASRTGEVLGEEPLDLPGRGSCSPRRSGGRSTPEQLAASGVDRARRARVRRTPPSTRRSGCCRCSPPATAGTSAASRRRCTRTPGCSRCSCTTATRAAPASPSRASPRPPTWLAATREAIASCAVRRRLPVVRAVTEVRQRQQPARQARRRPAARCSARGPSLRSLR